ncbi:hypothetical protein DENSPDRAFT_635595 [Dentipellis sp. KUC8613]|nr:hypothetical protein DENSPDRAFT_635595 [Dentipellis sp. KUC8613]
MRCLFDWLAKLSTFPDELELYVICGNSTSAVYQPALIFRPSGASCFLFIAPLLAVPISPRASRLTRRVRAATLDMKSCAFVSHGAISCVVMFHSRIRTDVSAGTCQTCTVVLRQVAPIIQCGPHVAPHASPRIGWFHA